VIAYYKSAKNIQSIVSTTVAAAKLLRVPNYLIWTR
jgi:hypothetical protein